MNPIKRLAGQTAIYGFTSVIGRLLGWLLVPLYTRVFTQGEYGTVIEMYSYVAFLNVILTYGMETAFFRYSELEKNKNKVFGTSFISLLITSSIFVILTTHFSQNIANLIRYPNHKDYIIWFAFIVSIDALSSIPFAKLRAQNKAKRFATIKLIGILINISLNLFLILLCPYILKNYESGTIFNFIKSFYNTNWNIEYIFISNLIASGATLILLSPEIFNVKLTFSTKLWRRMIIYALPLLIAGLAGIMNETLDRILLKYLLPPDIAISQVGIYGACYKISIIMTIFIQAFRYAADPFFFSQEKEKNSKILYAKVMNYFVIAVSFIFLITMMYIDIIIKFIGKDFRVGAPVIPILLLANLFLGIYYNLSIWYKLTNKTIFAALLSIFGAIITVTLNFYWIPRISYMGSAWATFICYGSMMLLSYILGQKYYPIKYNFKKIFEYLGLSLSLYFISISLNIETQQYRLLINTFFVIIFISVVYFIEKPKFLNFKHLRK